MKKALYILVSLFVLASCAGTDSDAPVIVGITGHMSGSRVVVNNTYVQSVINAGGIPMLLPPVTSEEQAAAVLDKVSGVLFTGGADIDPRYYGEEVINESVEIEPDRDTSDMIYASLAIKRHMPMLGICRGEQILNVALGGTLYQDLPSQYLDTLFAHRGCFDEKDFHDVALAAGSRVAQIFGTGTLRTNSNHHQAVKDLAPGLAVSGWTADGVVEAYESVTEGLDLIALQCHPETFASTGDTLFLKVFQDFVRRSSESR